MDDDLGVEEALNEIDQYGNGISVPATYRMILSEKIYQPSPQREMQLQIDGSLQYFFSFDWTESKLLHTN